MPHLNDGLSQFIGPTVSADRSAGDCHHNSSPVQPLSTARSRGPLHGLFESYVYPGGSLSKSFQQLESVSQLIHDERKTVVEERQVKGLHLYGHGVFRFIRRP